MDGHQSFGRFRLGAELGRGGMGIVRLAEDPELGRQLAIKFVREAGTDAAAQFLNEAQITAQLEHPNIVPVHEVGRDVLGRPWIAMKHIEGDSLAKVIEEWKLHGKRGALRGEDYSTILGIFNKACDAVAFAHSRGVIHRDIKPANIMVGAYGEVLVVDWGLAKGLGRRDSLRPGTSERIANAQVTLVGDVFGTPAYMAPEQARGDVDQISERTDIFALGATLFHLVTLCPPYSGRHSDEVLARARQYRLTPPRRRAPNHGIPRELEAIILKAMAHHPGDRYSSVRALQEDLAAWQDNRPTLASPPGPLARMAKAVKRHPTASITTALLVSTSFAVLALVGQLSVARAHADLARSEQDREAALRTRAEAEARAANEEGRAAASEADAAKKRALLAEVSKAATEGQLDDVRRLLAEHGQDTKEIAYGRMLVALRRHLDETPDGSFSLSAEEVERFETAFAYLEQVAKSSDYTLSADDYYLRGLVRRECGEDLRLAITDFTTALQLNGMHAEALRLRGASFRDLGQLNEALADLDATLDLHPDSGEAHRDRGQLWCLKQQWTRAVEDYAAAFRLNPKDWSALHGLAHARAQMGEVEAALRDYQLLFTRDPNPGAAPYNDRGSLFMGLHKFEEARRDFDQALEQDADCLAAYLNRSKLNYLVGDNSDAVRDASAAIRIARAIQDGLRKADWGYQPDWLVRGYELRAVANHALGNNPMVVEDCDTILKMDPSLWTAWWLRAGATQGTDVEETRHALTQAYRLCSDAVAREQIANQLRAAGGQVPE
ncbi:MAG: protein kinase [Vicinamibacterales bacterium]